MPVKISTLANQYSKKILHEMRGISLEVRAWAKIIQEEIETEYKKYWDAYTARLPKYGFQYSVPTYNNSKFYGRSGNNAYDYDYDYFNDFYNFYGAPNNKKLTKDDLALMDANRVTNILTTIMDYHGLNYDAAIDLKPDEIVRLYNETLIGGQIKESIEGESDMPTKPEKIIIDGKKYPEAYENFRVDRWIISDGSQTEYDHVNSGYENGEYVVYINCNISINVSLFVLIHEIKHAYQDWQRISKNRPPIKQTKEILQLYTKDFEKYILSHNTNDKLKTLDSIIFAYYMSSNVEVTAYLEGVYDDIVGQTENKYYKPRMQLYDLGKNMSKFKASDITKTNNPEQLQKNWEEINEKYNIPLFRKFKSVFDFLNYTERQFNNRGRKIIKKIDKLRTI